MDDVILSAGGLSISFDGRSLFSNLSFELRRGEKMCLRGHSGSGKSTLLNIIMGFIKPDSGMITFLGKAVSPRSIASVRKNICWLPQNLSVLGAGSVRDNFLLPFQFEVNKANTPAAGDILEAFGELGLNEKIIDSDMETISGGEKQRVGLALCKLLRKRLILLDEPTSALDAESVDRAVRFILADPGLTVISTSHDERWAAMCNKIIETG